MEIDVIKYIGGPKHITILYRNTKSKQLFVFYCYTRKPQVNIEKEYDLINDIITGFRIAEITIPINTYNWYQLEIEKESDFDLVEKVVRSIMEEHE